MKHYLKIGLPSLLLLSLIIFGCIRNLKQDPGGDVQQDVVKFDSDEELDQHVNKMIEEGREIFRFDTFGDEVFWGDTLKLHLAIAGEKNGGVGPGLSPNQALALGLKVDYGALPKLVVANLTGKTLNLDDPAMTLTLLKANAVVGVKGFFDKDDKLSSIGIQCALCHSTVNNNFAAGIGTRMDGWPNRDLNVGAILNLAPNMKVFADVLGISVEEARKVFASWGPGKYDAELIHDGKGFRPDGKTAATLLPAAFGMAGVNLHTYTGWGSVTHWNAYVANTQMHGQGRFYDPRLEKPNQFAVTKRTGMADLRDRKDLITSKLAALHFYQLALPIPKPPKDSFNEEMAKRGEVVFNNKAECASCHVPPIFTEPGYNMHTPEEIGIDDFQASRSPDRMYRTTPLRGLWARSKGGFYHDGRFATLRDVVEHYDSFRNLNLTEQEKNDLIQYLKSI